jgi:hypothetical protein
MGNTYYAYTNIQDFQGWSELFGLIEEDIIFQKRILSIISGAILPLVALGFIKSLVDYIKPEDPEQILKPDPIVEEDDALPREELEIVASGDKPEVPLENNVDVISISEMKEEYPAIQIEEASDLPDLQYVNVGQEHAEANNQNLPQTFNEIKNANSNRKSLKQGVPPFI